MDTVRLRLSNRLAVPRTVTIEPWTGEIVLEPGQIVTLISRGDLTYAMELELTEDGAVFYAFDNAGAMVRIYDADGKELF